VTLGAFDLLEGLDIFVLGPVHDRKDFGDEVGFVTRPVTARTSIQRFKHYLFPEDPVRFKRDIGITGIDRRRQNFTESSKKDGGI
jgi:hypothetical protein